MTDRRISLCMISKGEDTLLEALRSARPHVDEVVVVFTRDFRLLSDAWSAFLLDALEHEVVVVGGEALKLVDRWEVYTEANDAQGRIADFAKARQRSFDLASHDVAFWMDSDDVLRNGERLREVAATMPERPAFVELPYEYETDGGGQPTCVQVRERLVYPRRAWRWKFPVHEALVSDLPGMAAGSSTAVTVVHARRGSADHERNLRILCAWIEREPDCARAWFYLGLGNFDAGEFEDAEKSFAEFLKLDAHPDEKAMACLRLSWIGLRNGDPKAAIDWAARAHAHRPWDSCCFALARAWQAVAEDGDDNAWERVAFWSRAGFASPPTQTKLWVNPMEREAYAHATYNAALAKLGDVEGALASVEKALSHLPDDEFLKGNEVLYRAEVARRRLEAAKSEGATVAKRADELFASKVLRLDLRDSVYATLGLQAPAVDGSLDWVFACGEAVEPWNPRLIDKQGMGGSEQAVMHVARELARRGHRVRVYCNCGTEGHYDGVSYLRAQRFFGTQCEVLVSWRSSQFLEFARADARFLWAHDTSITGMDEWTASLADRVMCLSDWHRECLALRHGPLVDGKLFATRNGIDPKAFTAFDGRRRDPRRALYTSSPTRGLPLLLDWWPEVRRLAPGATLGVAYGFESWRRMAANQGCTDFREIDELEERCRLTEGVELLGRLPPSRLYEEMASSGVWVHPSWETGLDREWYETSCIGAMEAQASGMFTVATKLGALEETVGEAGTLIDCAPNTVEGALLWQLHMAAALGDGYPADGRWTREGLKEGARKRFDWAGMVDGLEREARHCLGEANPGIRSEAAQ